MKKRLLIICLNWPAPNYSAAGVRMFQLIDFFQEEDYSITLACTAENNTYQDFNKKGIETVQIRLNHESFDVFVKEFSPDVVLFDRFMAEEQFGWRVKKHAPKTLLILDTEDLHSLRKAREEALKKNIDFTTDLWLENDVTKREMASIFRCDLSLIISSFEMNLLTETIGIDESLLLQLPFMLDALPEGDMATWPSFEARKDFVFIGFGGHAPNVDAISYLKTEIWPLIHKALPETKLHIYGGNFPEKVGQMHQTKEGFLVHGWASDSKATIESARVLLAPLRFGAGLKGKLVDAMQYGTPSVTTSIGAEGMNNGFAWSGKIENAPNTFAEAAIALYQNERDWTQCQVNGAHIINSVYDKKSLVGSLKVKISSIKENLAIHRVKNFVGAMLQHQTMASTKYMSKWIAEKNRDV